MLVKFSLFFLVGCKIQFKWMRLLRCYCLYSQSGAAFYQHHYLYYTRKCFIICKLCKFHSLYIPISSEIENGLSLSSAQGISLLQTFSYSCLELGDVMMMLRTFYSCSCSFMTILSIILGLFLCITFTWMSIS